MAEGFGQQHGGGSQAFSTKSRAPQALAAPLAPGWLSQLSQRQVAAELSSLVSPAVCCHRQLPILPIPRAGPEQYTQQDCYDEISTLYYTIPSLITNPRLSQFQDKEIFLM